MSDEVEVVEPEPLASVTVLKPKAVEPKKPKSKPKHKAAPKKVAKVPTPKKVKAVKSKRTCKVKGCTKPLKTPQSQRCATHNKAARTLQLKRNNVTWKARVKKGTAKHHVVYGKQATVWALQNKDKALKLVKSGHSIVPTVKAFEEAVRKVPEELKRAARK